MSPRTPAEPRFTLGGQGQSRLSLTAPVAWGVGEVTQLEIDLAGRANDPPTRRRGRVHRAELVIDEAALNRALTSRLAALVPLLPALGPTLEYVHARFLNSAGGAQIRVLARLCDDGIPVWCSLRARLRAGKPDPGPVRAGDPLALCLVEDELRVYGLTSTPAPVLGLLLRWALALPLCAHAQADLLLLASTPEARLGLRLLWASGVSAVGVELLYDAMMATLPRAGYRCADPATASLAAVRVDGGRLHLAYRSVARRESGIDDSSDEWSTPASDPITFASREALGLCDRLLLDGDCAAAVAAYALVEQDAGIGEAAQVRRRHVLLTAPARLEEAGQLCSEALRRVPGDAQARLALAFIAAAYGDHAAAASQLLALGEDTTAEVEDRALAVLAAARCLTPHDLPTASAAVQKAQTWLAAAPDSDAAVAQEAAALLIELSQTSALSLTLSSPPVPVEPGDGEAALEEPEQILQRALAETLPAALARIDRALRLLVGAPRLRLGLGAARLCQQRGEIARARLYLEQAGDHPEALHQRVLLDLPELTVAEPGGLADLLPVLQRLWRRGLSTSDELYALAQLHSARGQHRDAFAAQRAAGGDPEELLSALLAAGQHRAVVDALLVHARLLPDRAVELYRRAARVAQQQLADPARAAPLWQAAAEALTQKLADPAVRAEAAALWAHAGHLWHAQGSYDRAEAALRRALELGGEQTPLVLLALGHHAYAQANLEGAASAYRRALLANQVPKSERPQVFLRLAEIEHERGDAAAEERELAAAVESGGGALSWPALAALFRASGDGPRLGTALLAWADYETGEMQRSLLIQAAVLCGPSLIGRVDEELTRIGADDEAVRDRVQTRLRQAGSEEELLSALLHDLEKSAGLRRLTIGREVCVLGSRLADDAAVARGHIALLERLDGADGSADALVALAFFTDNRRVSGSLPEELSSRLRELLQQKGRLRELLAQMDRQLALLTEHPRERRGRAQLLRQTAELAELLGDSAAAATRWLRLCGTDPDDLDALTRCRRLLREQATSGHAAQALLLCERELRRFGDLVRRAHGLRIVQAELLLFLDRPAEALAQLELVLMRAESFGPAHALMGLQLASSVHPFDTERSVEHLLLAAYAPDVDPHEAGECALVAAELLDSLRAAPRHKTPTQTAARPVAESTSESSYLGRSAAGTWVAVPADFLDEALDDGQRRAASSLSPPRFGAGPPTVVSATPPPALGDMLRAKAEPRALLLHAAVLLPADPRPLEGLLAQAFAAREYEQAIAYCDRLLVLAPGARERARLLVEKAYVLLRVGGESTAHALLAESLALLPEHPPALRALRLLAREGGDLDQAVALLQRELHGQKPGDHAGRAALLLDLGELQKLRGDPSAALVAFYSAGQLGSPAAWRRLAAVQREQHDFLGAADAMGRAAALLPAGERGAVLVEAAELAVRADDELRARDHLEQAVALGGPASEGARALLLELDGGPDATARRRTLERRLQQVSEGIGHIDVLARLLLLCRTQGDEAATARYAQALLVDKPGDELALCALAEQAYRAHRLDEAETLLGQVTAVPESLERPATVLRCLAELRARRGDFLGAERAYGELLARGEHDAEGDAVLAATTALAELLTQRGAFSQVVATLKVRLLYLPEAASPAAARDERVALRLRIAEAAERAGDLPESEHQLGCVLDELPKHREALRRIRLLYAAHGDDERTLEVLSALVAGATSLHERVEWLSERAALHSERGKLAAAVADFQQVLALIPGDQRTLQRLAALTQRRDAQVRPATSSGPAPIATELATAIAVLQLPASAALDSLDPLLDRALTALAGDAVALAEALRRRLFVADGLNIEVAQALARLAERADSQAQHVYLALLAFIAPGGAAEARLLSIGPRPLLPMAQADAGDSDDDEEPWLRALALLARLLIGLPAASLPLSAEWGTRLLPLAQRLGFPTLTVAVVDELRSADDPLFLMLKLPASAADPASLAAEPAHCDPTQPPRLRLRRPLTDDLGQAHFAALRALHLHSAGEPLLRWLDAGDTAALLRAAAALWVPGIAVQSARQSELQALLQVPGPPSTDPLKSFSDALPDALVVTPQQAAAVLSPCLLRLHAEPGVLHELRPLLRERIQQRALAKTLAGLGDVLAALRALALPPPPDYKAARLALGAGPLGEVVRLALRLYAAPTT